MSIKRKIMYPIVATALCSQILTLSIGAANTTVRMGSRGEDVKTLQTMLNEVEDANLEVDGVFGKDTKQVLISFQTGEGIAADGIAGPVTWNVLTEAYENEISEETIIAIEPGKYNPRFLKPGKAYSIQGNIISNKKIKSVTVSVCTDKGIPTSQTKTAYLDTETFDIRALDDFIRFGSLEEGKYMLRISAVDASSKEVVLAENAFMVTKADVYSMSTDSGLKLSNNFTVSEFASKDGSDTVLIDPQLVTYLQSIRNYFGKAVIINSGYRSLSHNAAVGGASNSKHTYGQAADIRLSGVTPKEVAKYAESIGIKGIGLYGTFVHVDTREKQSFWYTSEQQKVTTFQ